MHFVVAGHSDNPAAAAEHLLKQGVNLVCINNNGSDNSMESFNPEEFDNQKRYGA
jgi:hypothetical protein